MKYAALISTPVPQTQPLNKSQVKNNAGGFVYAIDIWSRLNRFLILGSDSNTYYQKAPDLTRQNAQCVQKCFDDNPVKAIDVIVSTSLEGRAPKNDAAIFALAIGGTHKDVKVRALAHGALPAVCRTATHLFQYLEARKALGGGKGGRALHRAISKWYNDKSVDAVAFQMIKYRNRNAWDHKNVHQLHHPSAGNDETRRALYQWVRGVPHSGKLPEQVVAHIAAMNPETSKIDRIALTKEYKLPWEALPTECNSDPDYWKAMLPTMGLTALLRNLANMTRIGLVKPLSDVESAIVARLSDENEIRKSRLHPFNILVALKTYDSGRGFRGGNTWNPSPLITTALDKAFYKAFKNVQPTGKRFLFGLDVSGSMSTPMANSNVACCEATAALSLVALNTEPRTHVIGFANTIRDLKISATDSLLTASRKAQDNNFGSTDCSAAITYAQKIDLEVDVFVIMTDNETYAGRIHPSEALKKYRKSSGINAKMIVVGMTSTGFSIADPNDPLMLDVAGFDTSVPSVMAGFARS